MVKRIFGTLAAVMLLSANAYADVIIDTVEQEVYVGWGGYHSYWHSPELPGTATGGTLEIQVWDDNRGLNELLPEVVVFVVEDFDFDTGGFTFGSAFSGDLEIEALGALNSSGVLQVTVKSLLGDFYVGDSVLTVYTSVPEPGTLALLGLGLVGMGMARRRRS